MTKEARVRALTASALVLKTKLQKGSTPGAGTDMYGSGQRMGQVGGRQGRGFYDIILPYKAKLSHVGEGGRGVR
jgi:hypothetical protein